jgi:hypothetical protein
MLSVCAAEQEALPEWARMDSVKSVDAQLRRRETEVDEANMLNEPLVSRVAALEGQLRRMLGAQDQIGRERDKSREEASAWRQRVIGAKAEWADAKDKMYPT